MVPSNIYCKRPSNWYCAYFGMGLRIYWMVPSNIYWKRPSNWYYEYIGRGLPIYIGWYLPTYIGWYLPIYIGSDHRIGTMYNWKGPSNILDGTFQYILEATIQLVL